MADIATIFHWPLGDMEAMEIEDLARWRQRAAARTGDHE